MLNTLKFMKLKRNKKKLILNIIFSVSIKYILHWKQNMKKTIRIVRIMKSFIMFLFLKDMENI
jgi:hypothetical protein